MKKLTFLTSMIAVLVIAISAFSAGPNLMSYQGQVLTSGGAPVANGSYPAVFSFYPVPAGGILLWSESGSITTSAGLFTHTLGSITAIPTSAFTANPDVWLDVTVNGQVQTPRTQLTSASNAISVGTVDGATGGTIGSGIYLGKPLVSNGYVSLFSSSSASSTGGLYDWSGQGAALLLSEETGINHAILIPDGNGTGGEFQVYNGLGGWAFNVDGNRFGSGQPYISMDGLSDVGFDLTTIGNNSVLFPSDAIAAPEILDEPGIANNWAYGGNILNTLAMQDLVTVTISIPAPGYIVLSGDVGEIDHYGTTSLSWAFTQIDETAGGSIDGANPRVTGAYNFPSVDYFFYTAHCQRIYYKAAGTYTFRLEAQQGGASAGATVRAWYPSLQAVYYPTSYGTVAISAMPAEAGAFEFKQMMGSTGASPATGAIATETYSIDLRELELKVAKSRAETERLGRELAEARLKEQLNSKPVPADDNK